MKRIFFTAFLGLWAMLCFAQKPSVDLSTIDNWAMVNTPVISNNGKYAAYQRSGSLYHPSVQMEMVIRQIGGSWKKEMKGVYGCSFTADSRTAIFKMPNDSLCLLKLGTGAVEYIPAVSISKLFSLDKQEYLAISKKTADKELLLRNLTTGRQQTFTGIIGYELSPNNSKLVLNIAGGKESGGLSQLALLNLRTGIKTDILKCFGPSSYVFDQNETQLAFTAMQAVNKHIEHVFYDYTLGQSAPVKIIDNEAAGLDTSLNLERIVRFSKDGKRLFFTVKSKPASPVVANGVMVDVWNYQDVKLQSAQLGSSKPNPFALPGGPEMDAVVTLADKHLLVLTKPDDQSLVLQMPSDDFVFPVSNFSVLGEALWNKADTDTYYIESAKTGIRKKIDINVIGYHGLSPAGRFVIGTDTDDNYCAMELATGKIVNMTAALPIPKVNEDYDVTGKKPNELAGLAGWLENDRGILVYDKYDIWQLDPSGKKQPVNLTGGYGRKHQVAFRFTDEYYPSVLTGTETIILNAFNKVTKENGFYSMQMNNPAALKELTMGPYLYDIHQSQTRGFVNNSPIVKAKGANVWIVRRESTSESPNFFTTTDFKTFVPLSDVHPEKSYNWLTSELMSWKAADGKDMPGILYKPENFDPTKKYPVIFYYYEKFAEMLHNYLPPELATDRLNIPWYVSRGYLVYVPDIFYTIPGKPGECALNSVVGAAKMLSAFPWVDKTHMGLQGHSFGGFETLYIVTHTNIFAAAMAGSGISDMVSDYNGLFDLGLGTSLQVASEQGQLRIGGNLWQKQDLFFENSPVLQADKVTTPLLMMNNMNDAAVPYTQGVEMFTSLRRLGKRAWMLQYDGQAHSVWGNDIAKDYTIRMDQFFDHYLKGAPAPMWMLKGVPATKKGIDNGFELSTEKDANGNPVTPGPGLLK